MCHKNVLLFASGNGSNVEAIVNYFKNYDIKFKLVSDKKDSNVLKRAKKLNLESVFVLHDEIENFLNQEPAYDLYVLSGYMRILSKEALFGRTFINIHPSYLPSYKGCNAVKRAYNNSEKETGITIHFVNENVDEGEIIYQEKIRIDKNRTYEEIETLIHNREHQVFPLVIEKMLFKKKEKYNVLLYGGGARECVLANLLRKSPLLGKLFLAKANDGFSDLGKVLDFTDYKDLALKAYKNDIDLLITGPENPLADGITDIFKMYNIDSIGPNQYWAKLESSKIFAKKFMNKNSIRTARYKKVSNINDIKDSIKSFKSIPVLKANGLAQGKGVVVSKCKEELIKNAKEFINGKFKDSSSDILFEERLEGKEVSLMSLWDGKTLLHFPLSCDYKKLSDSENAPNTGGMGSFAPCILTGREQVLLDEYKDRLHKALLNEKADFKGIIYSGLIFDKKGLYVLEYNVRFGDPEIQALSELADFDFLEAFIFMKNRKLNEFQLSFNNKKSYCVVVASSGYPANPLKGGSIGKIFEVKEKYGVEIYFAGVKKQQGEYYADGGRVLSIVKSGCSLNSEKILSDIYKAVSDIEFKDKLVRFDIGK